MVVFNGGLILVECSLQENTKIKKRYFIIIGIMINSCSKTCVCQDLMSVSNLFWTVMRKLVILEKGAHLRKLISGISSVIKLKMCEVLFVLASNAKW